MTVNELLKTLDTSPATIEFSDVMLAIDSQYTFTEACFSNGETSNKAGQNNGSCKILAFAKLHNLNQSITLSCFGKFYFDDVLKNPDGDDHQNIRQFIIHGWDGVQFSTDPLTPLADQ